mmetsp:Transcript_57060/g.107296  ORF Transcript_57060/g.107296 Transcript_57060/m.107296 type:complete len:247 (+) Transcript_57060:409-1149(+)
MPPCIGLLTFGLWLRAAGCWLWLMLWLMLWLLLPHPKLALAAALLAGSGCGLEGSGPTGGGSKRLRRKPLSTLSCCLGRSRKRANGQPGRSSSKSEARMYTSPSSSSSSAKSSSNTRILSPSSSNGKCTSLQRTLFLSCQLGLSVLYLVGTLWYHCEFTFLRVAKSMRSTTTYGSEDPFPMMLVSAAMMFRALTHVTLTQLKVMYNGTPNSVGASWVRSMRKFMVSCLRISSNVIWSISLSWLNKR